LHITLTSYSFLIFGEEPNKALAVEGTMESKISIIGFKMINEENLIYSKSCEEKPVISVTGKVTDLVAFVSQNTAGTKGPYLLKNCKNRILIEPVTVNLEIERTWTFKKDSDECTMNTKVLLTLEQVTATLTFQDVYFMLGVARHELKHIMNDYIEKVYRYYLNLQQNSSHNAQRLISHKLSQHISRNIRKLSQSEGFTKLKNIADLGGYIGDTLKLITQFQKDNEQLEKLKQRSLNLKKNYALVQEKSIVIDLPQMLNYSNRRITHTTNEFTARFNEDIKLIYINDIEGVFYPLLEIELAIPLFTNSQFENQNKAMHLQGKVCANYYHCAASAWEPLVEPFRFEYLSEFNAENRQKNSKFTCSDPINLNFTNTLIMLIKDSVEIWKSRGQAPLAVKNLFIRKCRKSDVNLTRKSILNSEYDSITEFILKNHSGVTFYITINESLEIQRYPIFPDETVNLLIDPSEALSKIKRIGKNKFNIKIEFDSELGIPPIEKLNLTSVKEFTHNYTVNGEKHYFICVVTVEQMRKVFTLSTPYALSNNMDLPVTLAFISHTNIKTTLKLKPNETISIPMNLLGQTGRIIFGENENYENTTASKFTFETLQKLFDTHKAVQLKISSKSIYGVVALCKGTGIGQSRYSLLPPFNFVNCLPVRIKLQFHNTGTEMKLESGKSSLLYSCSTTVPVTFAISLPQYELQEVKFKYDPDKLDIPISLKDKAGLETQIYMRILVNTDARYTLTFYSKVCIVNSTFQNLSFYYRNEDEEEFNIVGQTVQDKTLFLTDKHKSFVCYLNDFCPSTPIIIGILYIQQFIKR